MPRSIVACLALLLAAVAATADAPVTVWVDGELQSYRPAARLRNGTVYVPLRQGADSLGAQCKWEARTKTAQICTPRGCTIIRKGEGIVVDGSILLPLRRMSQALGAQITWDAPERAVRIERQ